jgi:hypothetical protein
LRLFAASSFSSFCRPLSLACLCALYALCGEPAPAVADASRYFAIQVVDDQTGRGVPLVRLETTNNVQYFTDSNGLIAYDEPGMMGTEVFFHVWSHGYEYPKDGFGYAGVRLTPTPGGSATVKIKRINIAERLYRVTGQGIYRDSVLLGRKCPTSQPVIDGLVLGCDSVLTAPYQGKLFWFWGDTTRPSYPLGNFYATGATSRLPAEGGLDPEAGVDFTYFLGDKGFVKGMTPMSKRGPTWPDGFIALADENGRERLYAAYSNVNTKMETLERGLCVYNDEKQVFESIKTIDLHAPVGPTGHPFKLTVGGTEYVYFAQSLPLRRTRADGRSYCDLASYEAFTCLKEGTRVDAGEVDRDEAGHVHYAWKHDTPPLGPQDEKKLIEAGKLKADEAIFQLRDVDTGKPVVAHAGSVYWNEYRKRWTYIVCEIGGTSMLGEIWYAEADTPLGPWVYARKVVTHNTYSFYNPKQHPYFAKEDGRFIFFEGTYTQTFSGSPVQTPRYDYNQVMYKLDLTDPRMMLPVPEYARLVDKTGANSVTLPFLNAEQARSSGQRHSVAFFAPDRPAPGLVPVYSEKRDHRETIATRPESGERAAILFYALPADTKNPPPTTALLCEDTSVDGHVLRIEETDPATDNPQLHAICRVWKSPTSLRYPLD